MKKNGILTLLFALIPGAGEMYQGYMKRGLSLITMFCLSVALGAWMGIEIFYIGAPILYMYSFFDTLISQVFGVVRGLFVTPSSSFCSGSGSLPALSRSALVSTGLPSGSGFCGSGSASWLWAGGRTVFSSLPSRVIRPRVPAFHIDRASTAATLATATRP